MPNPIQNQNTPVWTYTRVSLESGATWLVDFKDRLPHNRAKLDNTGLSGIRVRITPGSTVAVTGAVALGQEDIPETAVAKHSTTTSFFLSTPFDQMTGQHNYVRITSEGTSGIYKVASYDRSTWRMTIHEAAPDPNGSDPAAGSPQNGATVELMRSSRELPVHWDGGYGGTYNNVDYLVFNSSVLTGNDPLNVNNSNVESLRSFIDIEDYVLQTIGTVDYTDGDNSVEVNVTPDINSNVTLDERDNPPSVRKIDTTDVIQSSTVTAERATDATTTLIPIRDFPSSGLPDTNPNRYVTIDGETRNISAADSAAGTITVSTAIPEPLGGETVVFHYESGDFVEPATTGESISTNSANRVERTIMHPLAALRFNRGSGAGTAKVEVVSAIEPVVRQVE